MEGEEEEPANTGLAQGFDRTIRAFDMEDFPLKTLTPKVVDNPFDFDKIGWGAHNTHTNTPAAEDVPLLAAMEFDHLAAPMRTVATIENYPRQASRVSNQQQMRYQVDFANFAVSSPTNKDRYRVTKSRTHKALTNPNVKRKEFQPMDIKKLSVQPLRRRNLSKAAKCLSPKKRPSSASFSTRRGSVKKEGYKNGMKKFVDVVKANNIKNRLIRTLQEGADVRNARAWESAPEVKVAQKPPQEDGWFVANFYAS